MSNPSFKVDEVCAIIKECCNSGVLSFEFRGLKLDMGKPKPAPTIEASTPIPAEVQVIADTQTRAANITENLNKEQQELDQLLIDDPLAFFEAIKRGELTDEEKA